MGQFSADPKRHCFKSFSANSGLSVSGDPSSLMPQKLDHQSMNLMPEMLLGVLVKPMEASNPRVRILGQLHDSYIIACDAEGLLLWINMSLMSAFSMKLCGRYTKQQSGDSRIANSYFMGAASSSASSLNRITPELARNGFILSLLEDPP